MSDDDDDSYVPGGASGGGSGDGGDSHALPDDAGDGTSDESDDDGLGDGEQQVVVEDSSGRQHVISLAMLRRLMAAQRMRAALGMRAGLGGMFAGGDDDDDDDDDDDRGGAAVAGRTRYLPSANRHDHEHRQAAAHRYSDFAHATRIRVGDASHEPSPWGGRIHAHSREVAEALAAFAYDDDDDGAYSTEASGGAEDGGSGGDSGDKGGATGDAAVALAAAPAAAAASAPAAAAACAAPTTTTAPPPGLRPSPLAAAAGKQHPTARMLFRRELGLAPRRHGGSTLGGGWSASDKASLGSTAIPNRKRRRLLYGSATTDREVTGTHRGGSRIYGVQFSSDGALCVVASQGDELVLYDTATWSVLKGVSCSEVRWTVTSTDVSPDGQFVIYSSMDDCLHMLNVHGEYEMHESLEVDSLGRAIFQAQFSAGGSEIACGASGGTVAVYDAERKVTAVSVVGHDDDINSVCYLDRAYRPHLIATGSDDCLVKVWDRRIMGKGKGAAGVLPGHVAGLTCVSSKGDGVHLVSNCKDQTARLWDIRKMYSDQDHRALPRHRNPYTHFDYRWGEFPGWGRKYKHPHDASVLVFRGHNVRQTLVRAYFSPAATTGQRYVYTGSGDGCVYIYDALNAHLVARLDGHRGQLIRDVAWHPFEPVICSASFDATVGVWERAGGVDGGGGDGDGGGDDSSGSSDDDSEAGVAPMHSTYVPRHRASATFNPRGYEGYFVGDHGDSGGRDGGGGGVDGAGAGAGAGAS